MARAHLHASTMPLLFVCSPHLQLHDVSFTVKEYSEPWTRLYSSGQRSFLKAFLPYWSVWYNMVWTELRTICISGNSGGAADQTEISGFSFLHGNVIRHY